MQITEEQYAIIKQALFASAMELPNVMPQGRMGYGEDCVSSSHLVGQALGVMNDIQQRTKG